jgi:hypothetical protein
MQTGNESVTNEEIEECSTSRLEDSNLLAMFAGEREDSSRYAMTRIFRIRESFALWIKLNYKKLTN